MPLIGDTGGKIISCMLPWAAELPYPCAVRICRTAKELQNHPHLLPLILILDNLSKDWNCIAAQLIMRQFSLCFVIEFTFHSKFLNWHGWLEADHTKNLHGWVWQLNQSSSRCFSCLFLSSNNKLDWRQND